MIVWLIALIISVIAAITMSVIFVVFSLIALNGYMSMSAAMPAYLVFNCFAWPFMVSMTSLTSWFIFTVARRKQPVWQWVLMNIIIVTTILGVIALLLAFA
ncbi:MAG: hypothetical protein R6X34_21985 [Chloroflexota bacterium]